MPFSDLELSILPARLSDYSPVLVDEMLQAGDFVWQGDQRLGTHDGYVSLFAADDFPLLGRIGLFADGAREQRIRDLLLQEDGLDFTGISARLGGFPDEILRSLWKLVWSGEISSDSLDALRARHSSAESRYQRRPRPRYATRERIPPGAAGRWALLTGPGRGFAAGPARELASAARLLDRRGVVCPLTASGFERLLPLLERLEGEGLAQRTSLLGGHEVEIAAPGAEQVWRDTETRDARVILAAADPASPFGDPLPWPAMSGSCRPARAPGARVLIHDGRLVGYISATGRHLYAPRSLRDPAPVMTLLQRAAASGPVFIETVNGQRPYETSWHDALVDAGFSPSRRGYLLRRRA